MKLNSNKKSMFKIAKGLRKAKIFIHLLVSSFLLTTLSFSCKNSNEVSEKTKFDEFKTPKTFPLKFSEEKPLIWNVTDLDTLPAPKTSYLNLDNLPSKDFEFNSFKPLKKPMTTVKLDWDKIPTSNINLDTLPTKAFIPKISVITVPLISKLDVPIVLDNISSGILSVAGLESSQCFSAFVDRDGKKWFGTDHGLVQIDGQRMETYSTFRRVSGITQDKDGRIWLATFNDGVVVLDTKNGLQLNYVFTENVTDILCDYKNNIWISIASGDGNGSLHRMGQDFRTITQITFPEKLDGKSISLAEDLAHNLWIGQHHSIGMLDSTRTKLKTFGLSEGLDISYAMNLFVDKQGDVWSGSFNNNIYSISGKNKTLRSISLESGIYMEFSEDDEGNLWIMSQGGTIKVLNSAKTQIMEVKTDAHFYGQGLSGSFLDELGNLWIVSQNHGIMIIDTKAPFTEHFNTNFGLIDDNVWSIYEDSEKNIWLGTYNGINIYNPKTKKLKEFGAKQGYQKELREDRRHTNAILEYEKDKIFLGGWDGFNLVDKKKNIIRKYSFKQSFIGVNKAIQDNEERIWLTGGDRGIRVFDFEKNVVKTIDESISLVSSSSIPLLNDKKGNIWAGTTSGIFVLNSKKNTYKILSAADGLISNEIMSLELNGNGEIYVGTSTGISIINTSTETITNIGESEGLIPEMTFDLISLDSTVYVGSLDGLIEVKKPTAENENWTFNNYNVQNGMPNTDFNQNVSVSLKNGELWLGVWGPKPNLTVFRKKPDIKKEPLTTHITGLSVMDENTDFKKNERFSKYLSKGDTIWLTNSREYFTLNNLPEDSDYLSKNNIKWDSTYGYYSLPTNLVLPYNQNALNFSFNSNSVVGNKRIVYKYILEGSDAEWILGNSSTKSKNYYNLEAGNYTFKVISKDINNVWSEADEFSFTVAPPWWQTWWAYLLFAILFAALLRIYIVFRSKNLVRKNRLLEDKVSQRTKALEDSIKDLKSTQNQLVQSEKMASLGELTAGIAHEIQNPLNFVNNFAEVSAEMVEEMNEEIEAGNFTEVKEISKDLAQNLQKINHHGNRASSIVKGMLEHSRTNPGQKELIDINVLADEYLRLAYHGLRAKDKSFNAELVTDFDKELPKVSIVPQDFGRVILNLINNAFYATDAKLQQTNDDSFKPRVSVTTKLTPNNQMLIAIADNGSGIPDDIKDKIFQPFFTTKDSGKGTGLGLSLAYDIVKAHGGELKVETSNGSGTEFIITLPQNA